MERLSSGPPLSIDVIGYLGPGEMEANPVAKVNEEERSYGSGLECLHMILTLPWNSQMNNNTRGI